MDYTPKPIHWTPDMQLRPHDPQLFVAVLSLPVGAITYVAAGADTKAVRQMLQIRNCGWRYCSRDMTDGATLFVRIL